MPEHTKTTHKSASDSKPKAKSKRAGMEEKKTPNGPPKIPNPGVRKVSKGVGVLEIPVHISQGPQRLPEDESEYIHRARPIDAPLAKSQVQAIAAFHRGESLPEIAKSTGLPIGTLVKTLKTVGLSEETYKQQIEDLEKYYKNKRNP